MKFSKSFTVKGNIEKVFELTNDYMSGAKFQIVNQNKPNFLSLKSGSTFGSLTSFKIENAKTELNITLQQKGEDINILCDYDVKGYGSLIGTSDKSTLESEVEKLRNFLMNSLKS